jgi:hypothetical protein
MVSTIELQAVPGEAGGWNYKEKQHRRDTKTTTAEAEFLDAIWTKVIIVFLLAIHSQKIFYCWRHFCCCVVFAFVTFACRDACNYPLLLASSLMLLLSFPVATLASWISTSPNGLRHP